MGRSARTCAVPTPASEREHWGPNRATEQEAGRPAARVRTFPVAERALLPLHDYAGVGDRSLGSDRHLQQTPDHFLRVEVIAFGHVVDTTPGSVRNSHLDLLAPRRPTALGTVEAALRLLRVAVVDQPLAGHVVGNFLVDVACCPAVEVPESEVVGVQVLDGGVDVRVLRLPAGLRASSQV